MSVYQQADGRKEVTMHIFAEVELASMNEMSLERVNPLTSLTHEDVLNSINNRIEYTLSFIKKNDDLKQRFFSLWPIVSDIGFQFTGNSKDIKHFVKLLCIELNKNGKKLIYREGRYSNPQGNMGHYRYKIISKAGDSDFNTCCHWLSKFKHIKTPKLSSYFLKHVIEDLENSYIHNESVIEASQYLGIPMKLSPNTPNYAIAISKSDKHIKNYLNR